MRRVCLDLYSIRWRAIVANSLAFGDGELAFGRPWCVVMKGIGAGHGEFLLETT